MPNQKYRRSHDSDFGSPHTQSSARSEPAQRLLFAAEYIRMSTEHQRYSIENQQLAIASYAFTHNIKIVQPYIDPGRSGLSIERRDALRQLIDDVQNGQARFNTILVYDVSRWGRFQDVDEAAYYEFICKNAGVPVQYCAEPFENNGTMIAQIVKGLKRVMAGEYSRELSIKVFEAQKRAALRGTHHGGTTPYRLRRLLIDERSNPRNILKVGERKHFPTDSVVLTPGPSFEIKTNQRIFNLFVHSRMPRKHIAQCLNNEGLRNSTGNRWTDNDILRVLTNKKYIGNVIFGRTSKKLQGPTRHNPPASWARATGALKGIIDTDLFVSAQNILEHPWWSFSDNQLLDHLTACLCKHGYWTSRIISKSKFMPACITYHEHFGSLTNAFHKIGYKSTHGYYHSWCELLRPLHRKLIVQFISIVRTRTHKFGSVCAAR